MDHESAPPPSPLLTVAGLCTWIAVSVPNFLQATGHANFPIWLAAWLVFALALVFATRRSTSTPWVLCAMGIEAAAVVVMAGFLCNGFDGTLLVIVAAQLGLRLPLRLGLAWILLQTLALGVGVAIHWSLRPALLLTPPYLGFEIFAFTTLHLLAKERAARAALMASHRELVGLQGRLAERSRLDERLRIAQELHDAIGHHLTAMSLSLEIAAHQTEGKAHENVRTAQSLVRHVLGDVKEIVRSMSSGEDVDLCRELERLAAEMPSPRIHVALDDVARCTDHERSRALLRCVQEIVTNAIRHGQAQNVWIELRRGGSEIELKAHDDGRGADEIHAGHGLGGMRHRLEELGGTLTFESRLGEGFALRATLPIASGGSR
jgi:signal transduction histidine kinase